VQVENLPAKSRDTPEMVESVTGKLAFRTAEALRVVRPFAVQRPDSPLDPAIMNNKSWEGKGILRKILRFLSGGSGCPASMLFATCRPAKAAPPLIEHYYYTPSFVHGWVICIY
jgi:hypothetical protein